MVRAAATGATGRDQDIVELIRLGRRDGAFEELLRRYEGKVYRLCCALPRDRTLAEDAAQDSLVRVWKALDRCDGRASLSSWICAITRNRCLTALERRRISDSLDEPGEAPEAVLAPTAAQPWDGRAKRLRERVERMPERLRQILLLYYLLGGPLGGRGGSDAGLPGGHGEDRAVPGPCRIDRDAETPGLDDPACWAEERS